MITNEHLVKRYRQVKLIGTVIALALLCLLTFYKPNYSNNSTKPGRNFTEPMITSNTARIYGGNFYETACAVSQTAYPAAFDDDKPNAVILVREDKRLEGLLATRLIHYPIDAPILYITQQEIPEVTLKEMNRLDPQGVFMDRNIKVIIVGEVDSKVKESIRKMGWKYRNIIGKNPFELGKKIDDYISTIHGDHEDNIIIAPLDAPEYALVQTSWSSHTGDAFFFIRKDSVPSEVINSLRLRNGKAYMYVLGNEKNITRTVLQELSKYGHIQKVPEDTDIFSQSAGFSAYKDVGKNFGWWLGRKSRNFGWGITEPGHNFIFINPEDWRLAVSASVLSHKGKVGPMLLVNKDGITSPVEDYLNMVKPADITLQNQIFNHGWIIGDISDIDENTAGGIDELLSHGSTAPLKGE